MKGLIKVFSSSLNMRRERRMIGFLRGSMEECVLLVAQWVGHGKDGLIV